MQYEEYIIYLMPKKTSKTSKKIVRKVSKKRHIGYGVIAGTLLAALFILYLGYNNIKTNSVASFEQCVAGNNPVMESYPRQCRANGKTFVENLDNDSVLQIMQIDKSENGRNIHFERGNYIINSESEWENIFGEIDVKPDVNFKDKTVIAVVMGQKPSGGYSVSLKQLEVGKDTIQFMVEEVIPGEKCFVTEGLTNPYQIIAIDKTQKEIKFVGNTVVSECLE